MSQTDSHEHSQGELSGEVTNRLLMDMPQSPRRAENRLLTVVGVFIFLIAIGGFACAVIMLRQTGEKDRDYYDLSYHEFAKTVSKEEIDPVGASHIYYSRTEAPKGEEGYDLWMKMEIEQHSYDTLRNEQRRRMEDMKRPDAKFHYDPAGKIVVPNWGDYPIWWEDIKSVKSTAGRCFTWNVGFRGREHCPLHGVRPGRKETVDLETRSAREPNRGAVRGTSTPESEGDSNPAGETEGDTSNPGGDPPSTVAPAADGSADADTPNSSEKTD